MKRTAISPLASQGLEPLPEITLTADSVQVQQVETTSPETSKTGFFDGLTNIFTSLNSGLNPDQKTNTTPGIGADRLLSELEKGDSTNSLLLGLGAVVGVMVFILLIYKFK